MATLEDHYYIRHGKYWMLQWGRPIFLSVGVHLDYRFRYIDFHLGAAILTIGNISQEYEEYQAWWSSRWQQ